MYFTAKTSSSHKAAFIETRSCTAELTTRINFRSLTKFGAIQLRKCIRPIDQIVIHDKLQNGHFYGRCIKCNYFSDVQ